MTPSANMEIPLMNYQSHCSIIFSGSTSILEDPFQEETQLNFMHQPWNGISFQQSNNEVIIRNARKRATEASDATQETSSSGRNSKTNKGGEDGRRLKQFLEKQPKIEREKVGMVRRRSQKLTDKITALQKLVSPYGKTDTASVLLEAFISIKVLQDQIKELAQLISVQETTNMIGEKGTNLQSMGLCLVPCVFLKNSKGDPQCIVVSNEQLHKIIILRKQMRSIVILQEKKEYSTVCNKCKSMHSLGCLVLLPLSVFTWIFSLLS